MENEKSINVPILTRLEGHGALDISIKDKKIDTLHLRIFEPPRFFEKFLENRHFDELLDIVARICGICPIAYQMSASHAIGNCFQIPISPWLHDMRRLFYCGEWLESHNLHIHFLALPDFFGFSSITEMAKKYPDEVRRGLRLQNLGNDIIKMFGGRSVNPVGACVGGFYRAPSYEQVNTLLNKIKENLEMGVELIQWVTTLPFIDTPQNFTCVSLRHETEYPMNEGNIVSSQGLNIPIHEFDRYFSEYQVPYSNALHCKLQGKTYLVGPLARLNLNTDRLPESIKDILKTIPIKFPSQNMYHSVIARAIEVYYCMLEATRILESYLYPESSYVSVEPKAGIGYGCTEAPRGLLWHQYELDESGIIKKARIVPPTSQNQARIEEDLHFSLEEFGLERNIGELRARSEMIIRNYDPCISCSTHFLDFRIT